MEPGQIPISIFGRSIEPFQLLGIGFDPTPQIRMAIGEGEHAPVPVAASGRVFQAATTGILPIFACHSRGPV